MLCVRSRDKKPQCSVLSQTQRKDPNRQIFLVNGSDNASARCAKAVVSGSIASMERRSGKEEEVMRSRDPHLDTWYTRPLIVNAAYNHAT